LAEGIGYGQEEAVRLDWRGEGCGICMVVMAAMDLNWARVMVNELQV
jgi:hypothetical protein